MNITLEDLVAGSKAIEAARDDIHRSLSILKPICTYHSLISEKFTHPKTGQTSWWEVRDGKDHKPFFQLWMMITRGHPDRLWEGYAGDLPPAEKVMVVREALQFLLEACPAQIPDFTKKIQPYILAASKI